MYAAFERFCSYHEVSGPNHDMFLEKLKDKHDLDKRRKTTPEGKITVWKKCKLVKWKNAHDPTQRTLDDEEEDDEDEEGQGQQETPEEKYKREQEEIAKWG